MVERARYQVFPMIDPDSHPAYILVFSGFVVSFATVIALGFTLTTEMLLLFSTWPFLAFAAVLARRIGQLRLATGMEGVALLYGQGFCLMLFIYGMAAVGGPYADRLLASWDEALGFHWPAYVVATLPFEEPLAIAYKSFAWQPLVIVVALVWSDQSRRLWTLITAAILASAATALVFPFFPAWGVYNHYGFAAGGVNKTGAYTFHHALEYLRGGGRHISPRIMTGVVSFPSYHTAEAILFMWAGWTVKWLRWPIIALNLVVLASVPVIGAHYLSDMIGGVVLGSAAIVAAGAWMSRKNRVRGVDPSPP